MTPLTFEVAIILILKHAATLCLSGTPARTAISQSESNFQNANVTSKIEEHFTGPYEEYTIEQFVHFIMDTNFGLSGFISTQIMAYSTFKSWLNDKSWKYEKAIYHSLL